jgi:hypothetical protein
VNGAVLTSLHTARAIRTAIRTCNPDFNSDLQSGLQFGLVLVRLGELSAETLPWSVKDP